MKTYLRGAEAAAEGSDDDDDDDDDDRAEARERLAFCLAVSSAMRIRVSRSSAAFWSFTRCISCIVSITLLLLGRDTTGAAAAAAMLTGAEDLGGFGGFGASWRRGG